MPKKIKTITTKAKAVPTPIQAKKILGDFSLTNLAAVIVVLALLFLSGVYIAQSNGNKSSGAPEIAAVQALNFDCPADQNLLEVSKAQAEIQTEDSELGVFVTDINGTSNNEGSFWIYYVNGEMGQVGVDQYTCKDGDKVEWRYEKFY